MTDSPTFRVINLTEKRNVVTGLSLTFAHDVLKRMRETHKDSRYTVGPDIVEPTPTAFMRGNLDALLGFEPESVEEDYLRGYERGIAIQNLDKAVTA